MQRYTGLAVRGNSLDHLFGKYSQCCEVTEIQKEREDRRGTVKII